MGGLTGAITGFGMQWFASVHHYPFSIGGKPDLSWPAFMPITFEMTILFAAFAALGSMLLLNELPQRTTRFSTRKAVEARLQRRFLPLHRADGRAVRRRRDPELPAGARPWKSPRCSTKQALNLARRMSGGGAISWNR